MLGTLYPLALEMITGDKMSVGPPFFNATFMPADGAAAAASCRFGPLLAWKRGDLLGGHAQRMMLAFALAIAGLLALVAGAGAGR